MALTPAERTAILAVAAEAARDAGEILLRHLGSIGRDVDRKSSRRDLVTAADVESERLLVARLREAFPDHAIEAEEGVKDSAVRAGPRWFLDPLDGTNNFVHELPCFAISMGLLLDGVPEVAVVHAPKLAETFTATRGGGAFLNGKALRVTRTRELSDALLATGFPYVREKGKNANLENFAAFFHDVRDVRRMGSAALDLAYTAAGRFDGYWEMRLSAHDVAAGALLVREAGGLVTDFDGGEGWLRGGHIVASGASLHALIRARLRR